MAQFLDKSLNFIGGTNLNYFNSWLVGGFVVVGLGLILKKNQTMIPYINFLPVHLRIGHSAP